MKAPLEVIADLGLPTNSYLKAVQECNERFEKDQAWYEEQYNLIIGTEVPVKFNTIFIAKYHFQYAVQETIRTFLIEEIPDMERVAMIVSERVEQLNDKSPWLFKDYSVNENAPPKLDAAGNVKPKKGAKKVLAKQVYADEIEGKGMSRKDAIVIMMEKVGLTKAGASTYYANCKAGRY